MNFNDFDKPHQMKNLIEQYAIEIVSCKNAQLKNIKNTECDHPLDKRASVKSHGKEFCWKCGKHID